MRDYTGYSFYLTILVIAGLVCVSFIPPFTFAGIKFKRANILSELYAFDDRDTDNGEAEIRREDLDFVREMQDQANYADEGQGTDGVTAGEEPAAAAPVTEVWDLGGTGGGTAGGDADRDIPLDNVTQIEDYSPDGMIRRFCSVLESQSPHRNVRIAFLGDSFIEGDIITADVREQLQGLYGGQGVGFVALSSVTAEYRPTVKHTFRGWKDYQIANKKNVPEQYRDRFYISGTLSVPAGDAWAEYRTADYRKYISEVSNLRFFYSSTAPAGIKFTVNGEHERTFEADTTGALRQINVAGRGFTSLKVSVPKTEGFTGYGVSLEGGSGVLVDNYAIRSSTGLSLFGTSSAVNAAFNRLLPYDLIVVQYGLNIMSADVTGYTSYGEQMRNLVNYLKRCFPTAAIIVMSVGDRSMQKDGDFVTMPAVEGMVAEQRAVARDCGVGFWNTYRAMGGYNSMKRFAGWGWAAKDYTHLSFAGGRKIATEMVKALEYAKLHPYTGEPDGYETDEYPDNVTAPTAPVEPVNTEPGTEPAAADPTPEKDGQHEEPVWQIGEQEEIQEPELSPETPAEEEIPAGENPQDPEPEIIPETILADSIIPTETHGD